MHAMVLRQLDRLTVNPQPLHLTQLPEPVPRENEILVKINTCGVCHTELDEIEGRAPPASLPVILGHQIVGTVAASGPKARRYSIGDRVGIGWINHACGQCELCRDDQENLCADFSATGRDRHGGYAEYTTVNERFAVSIPGPFTDAEAAPLLCAGAIGYRSLRLSNLKDGQRLGLTGFGASAHLVIQMVQHRYPQTRVFVFARSPKERQFAIELGAVWAGATEDDAPEPLDCIIDTTPAWKPVVEGLRQLRPGGRMVINAIRKEQQDQAYLLQLDYPQHLWMEKEIKSVANVARRDLREFLELAANIPIRPAVQEYALADANQALNALKARHIRGAKVLRIA